MVIENFIAGILWSALGGLAFNIIILDWWLWPCHESKHPEEEHKRTDRIVVRVLGILERILYTFSILMGFPQWIAVWLTLKTASRWPGWKEDKHRKYNIFLIGNAVSILFAVIGAYICR